MPVFEYQLLFLGKLTVLIARDFGRNLTAEDVTVDEETIRILTAKT